MTQLKEPTTKDGALQRGLWLEWLKLDVPPISRTAGEFWEKVMQQVQLKYNEWQEADIMTKHEISTDESEKVVEPRWERLRARLSKLLLKAVPKGASDELVTQRLICVQEIMLYVLKRYQPGGLMEKSSLLQSVERVPRHATARGTADEIIAWNLKLKRIHELWIVPPDVSRLITEWLNATDELLTKLNNASLTFRV